MMFEFFCKMNRMSAKDHGAVFPKFDNQDLVAFGVTKGID